MIRVKYILRLLFVLGIVHFVETRNFHDRRFMIKLERIGEILKVILATNGHDDEMEHMDSPVNPHHFSWMSKPCNRLLNTTDFDRVLCKSSMDVPHLYNVKLQGGSLVVFLEDEAAVNNSMWSLPTLSSWTHGKHQTLTVPVVRTVGPMNPTYHCRQYFNGTLHIVGRSSAHNVYHACK